MRPTAEIEAVARLVAAGESDYAIARLTGVPRSTVRRWRVLGTTPGRYARPMPDPNWRPPDAHAYCYLLGVYLGDGCIHLRSARAGTLMVTLDSRYPKLIDEVAESMGRVFPGRPVGRYPRHEGGAVVLQLCTGQVRYAFPQHGAGKKHTRRIVLHEWQRALAVANPQPLLRGLIHSDGCRCTNRFRVRLPSGRMAEYAYARYFFTNLSSDIRSIFCEHCDRLGIHWTQSNHKNISVAGREGVAILDSFVGPKS